ncbi:putative non-specific serine/threonine protein kinase [Rosa chinensis]|uniref:Putative non-specific serine/threonine protein kinase n=1 Tax=Rosa chinensis TaxID=74649 RepID=A0A2P6Q351_ROSCH|nr:putative non-specific serine/threonine protein kinase [Rosa chinensis]
MCRNGEGFVRMDNVNVPDTSTVELDKNMSMEACEQKCLSNCSCLAYASADIRNGRSGCMTWFLAKKGMLLILVLPTIAMIFIIFSARWCSRRKTKMCKREAKNGYWHKTCYFNLCFKGSLRQMKHDDSKIPLTSHDGEMNQDLAFFDVNSIVVATDNFSIANKLGEGGFGSVYKVATYPSNLQHRNLVRLYGCCINSEEKMLIYDTSPMSIGLCNLMNSIRLLIFLLLQFHSGTSSDTIALNHRIRDGDVLSPPEKDLNLEFGTTMCPPKPSSGSQTETTQFMIALEFYPFMELRPCDIRKGPKHPSFVADRSLISDRAEI